MPSPGSREFCRSSSSSQQPASRTPSTLQPRNSSVHPYCRTIQAAAPSPPTPFSPSVGPPEGVPPSDGLQRAGPPSQPASEPLHHRPPPAAAADHCCLSVGLQQIAGHFPLLLAVRALRQTTARSCVFLPSILAASAGSPPTDSKLLPLAFAPCWQPRTAPAATPFRRLASAPPPDVRPPDSP